MSRGTVFRLIVLSFSFFAFNAHSAIEFESPTIENPCKEAFIASARVHPVILRKNHKPAKAEDLPWIEQSEGEKNEDSSYGVVYYTEKQLEYFKVYAHEGRLYDRFGYLIETPAVLGVKHPMKFAVMQDGELYILTDRAIEAIGAQKRLHHHSSLPGGRAVAAIGNILIEKGLPKEIDNSSGHYGPPDASLEIVMKRLEEMGVSRPKSKPHGNRGSLPKRPPPIFEVARNLYSLPVGERPAAVEKVLESGDEKAISKVFELTPYIISKNGLVYSDSLKLNLLSNLKNPQYREKVAEFILGIQRNEASRANGWNFFGTIHAWTKDKSMPEYIRQEAQNILLSEDRPEALAFARELRSDPNTFNDPETLLRLYHAFEKFSDPTASKDYYWTIDRLQAMPADTSLSESTRELALRIGEIWFSRRDLPGEPRSSIRIGDLPRTHAKSALTFAPAKLVEEYRYENSHPTFEKLDADSRNFRRIRFVNGHAYNAMGKLISTDETPLIYVLGLDGELYMGEPKFNKFHHSSFFAGEPVAGAGTIRFEKGVIVHLSNNSGHYKTTIKQFEQTIARLKELGARVSKEVLEHNPNSQ